MSGVSQVAKRIDELVKDVAEYLKQKDLAELKSSPAYVSEFTIATLLFIASNTSLDFIKDIEAIVYKHGFEVSSYTIYPLGGIYAVYINVALG